MIAANLLYGINYIIAKGVMPDHFTPRAIIFIRVSSTVVLFWLFSLFFPKEKVEIKDLLKLALCSIFGIAINQIMFFEGLNLTTPVDSSIIMTINPILVLIFSLFLIKEKITIIKISGILLGASGTILLITSQGEISLNSETFTGNIFIIINAASFALYLVMVKPLVVKYSAWTIMKWIFTFGFIWSFPFCIGPFTEADFSAIPADIVLSMIYIVIGATFLGYLLYNFALKRISPVLVSTYMYLQPLIASAIAVIYSGDKLTIETVISAVLIFAGVYFVSVSKISLLSFKKKQKLI
jgi:drug/metabolite transporter (DMT)-like permease